MKREVSFAIFVVSVSILFLFTFMSIASASSVGYLIRDLDKVPPEQNVLQAFSDLDLEISFIQDRELKSADLSGYEVIFIGDEKFKNIKYIQGELSNKNVVSMNHYYEKQIGMAKLKGANSLSSRSPLYVLKDGERVQVYMQGQNDRGQNLQYYYLSKTRKADGVEGIAKTYTKVSTEYGDVVAYKNSSSTNGRKCFFGITDSYYWTPEANEMFKNCVEFVRTVIPENIPGNQTNSSNNNNQTNTGNESNNSTIANTSLIHDINLEFISNSVNGIRVRDSETETYLIDTENISSLTCNKKYTISYQTRNVGNFTENISYTGDLMPDNLNNTVFNWSARRENLEPWGTTTTGSKTINMTFPTGEYSIIINALLENASGGVDAHLENNLRIRKVKVVC